MQRMRTPQTIEIVTVSHDRSRRWSREQSDAGTRDVLVGMNVSLGARQHGVGPSSSFNWRKLLRDGAPTAITAADSVVPMSELAAARALAPCLATACLLRYRMPLRSPLHRRCGRSESCSIARCAAEPRSVLDPYNIFRHSHAQPLGHASADIAK